MLQIYFVILLLHLADLLSVGDDNYRDPVCKKVGSVMSLSLSLSPPVMILHNHMLLRLAGFTHARRELFDAVKSWHGQM